MTLQQARLSLTQQTMASVVLWIPPAWCDGGAGSCDGVEWII